LGDQIQTGSAGSALIHYPKENARIDLDPNTTLTLLPTNGIRFFRLNQGVLYGTVVPQKPGKALVFLTPQAETKVLGTDFKLSSDGNHTELEVYSGKVRFSLAAKKEEALIIAGNKAMATEQGGMAVEPLPTPAGKILWEYWQPLNGRLIQDLTSHPRFPDQPSGSNYLTALEGPTNWGDQYGARICGLLHPPKTGDYIFWIAADDVGELWLSSTEHPRRKERICYTPDFTFPQEWEKHPQQQSRPVHLIGGRKYYLEAFIKEEGGGDCLAVAWETKGIDQEVIPGKYLSPVD
jgi:hypothetical protein